MSSKHSILDFIPKELLWRISDLGVTLIDEKRTEPRTERRNRSSIVALRPAPKNSTAAKIRTNGCLREWFDRRDRVSSRPLHKLFAVERNFPNHSIVFKSLVNPPKKIVKLAIWKAIIYF